MAEIFDQLLCALGVYMHFFGHDDGLEGSVGGRLNSLMRFGDSSEMLPEFRACGLSTAERWSELVLKV